MGIRQAPEASHLRRFLLPYGVGLCCFLLSTAFRAAAPAWIGDLLQAVRPAADLVAGAPPLAHPVSDVYVPSPLTIIPLGLPFVFIDPHWAAPLFTGLSCGLLALALRREPWRWLLFLSPAMLANIAYAQYLPLLMSCALLSAAPLGLLIKPHMALPLVLTYRARRAWWTVAFAVVGVSLVVYPLWPLMWLMQIRSYAGIIPVLLPFGVGLLLAALRWREREARLFLLYAITPQRNVYDQLPLLLVPHSRRAILLVIIAQWIVYLVLHQEAQRILAGYVVVLVALLFQSPRHVPIIMRGGLIAAKAPPPVNGSGNAP